MHIERTSRVELKFDERLMVKANLTEKEPRGTPNLVDSLLSLHNT